MTRDTAVFYYYKPIEPTKDIRHCLTLNLTEPARYWPATHTTPDTWCQQQTILGLRQSCTELYRVAPNTVTTVLVPVCNRNINTRHQLQDLPTHLSTPCNKTPIHLFCFTVISINTDRFLHAL